MTKDVQLRGHCPHCGAQQAVMNGTMAHHGYTVKWHYFQGSCEASRRHGPIETNAQPARDRIEFLRDYAARCERKLADLRAGTIEPGFCDAGTRRQPKMIPYAEGTPEQQAVARNRLRNDLEGQIYGCKGMAKHLEELIPKVEGKPLIEVERAAKPAPIQTGERRVLTTGKVGIAKWQEGARVRFYFEKADGRRFDTWMGVQAWRRLPFAN